MTLEEWLFVYTKDGDAQFVCAWRKRAWRVMRPVVEKFLSDRERGEHRGAGDLMLELDVARRAAKIKDDSKRWTDELARITKIVKDSPDLWVAPSADERAACLVAADLVEEHRYAEAIDLVRTQAPNAFNVPCMACGQPAGWRCKDLMASGFTSITEEAPEEEALREAGEDRIYRGYRIVPHEVRMQPRDSPVLGR